MTKREWTPAVTSSGRPCMFRSEVNEVVAALEAEIAQLPKIKISDGDVWLVFPDTLISIEGICRFGAPGPIVKRNLRRWRDETLAIAQKEN